MLEAEKKYIIESYSSSRWDWIRKIERWYWTKKVAGMTEGDVLRLYRAFTDKGGGNNE